MYFSWISSIYAISVFHYHPAKKTDQSEDTDITLHLLHLAIVRNQIHNA